MNLLNTLLGLVAARESITAMEDAYETLGMPLEQDPDPALTERTILTNLAHYGAQSQRALRIGGPGGVVGTAQAIERLARAGLIEADEDGQWSLL